MSLISAKNLALPIEKRWQLFSMLLMVLLFGILRLSATPYRYSSNAPQNAFGVDEQSGAGNYAPNYAPPQAAQANYRVENQVVNKQVAQPAPVVAVQAVQKNVEPAAVQVTNSSNSSILQELIGKDQDHPVVAVKPNNGSLDDIEKKLGMR